MLVPVVGSGVGTGKGGIEVGVQGVGVLVVLVLVVAVMIGVVGTRSTSSDVIVKYETKRITLAKFDSGSTEAPLKSHVFHSN